MRTVILGSKGQLGRDLLICFGRDGEVMGLDLPELDIADEAPLADCMGGAAPDLVVNAAAYTDVEGAEDDAEAAFRVNEKGARLVAAAAAQAGAPVVYFSTDFVFDGAKGAPYTPDDPLDPAGVYARSKAAGEAATRAANPRHHIVRTAWLYGPGGNNFVEKILRAARTRDTLRVVTDEVGSPTYTHDLAEAARALCRTEAYGIYHAVNAGTCSRFEFARAIVRRAGLKTRVVPCLAKEFPTRAPRPRYSVLSNEKLERVTGHVIRHWDAALAEYLERREQPV